MPYPSSTAVEVLEAAKQLQREQEEAQAQAVQALERATNAATKSRELKAVLEEPLKVAGYPSFTNVLNFCKQDAYNLFLKGSPVCVPNVFFGRCFNGDKCTQKHTLPKEAQVEAMLKMVEPFVKNPIKLKSGQ